MIPVRTALIVLVAAVLIGVAASSAAVADGDASAGRYDSTAEKRTSNDSVVSVRVQTSTTNETISTSGDNVSVFVSISDGFARLIVTHAGDGSAKTSCSVRKTTGTNASESSVVVTSKSTSRSVSRSVSTSEGDANVSVSVSNDSGRAVAVST